MILKLYRGHDPLTIIILVITACLVWIQPFIHPVEAHFLYDSDPMPLFALLKGVTGGNNFAGTMVSFVLVLVTGFYLVNFNTRIFFINERTFLPAAIFIILSGYIKTLQALNPVLLSSLLLIFATDRIIGSYRKQGIAYNFFDASLMISIGSLIYFNTIWFFFAVIAGIGLLRTISLREIILSVTGLLTPYIVVIAWYYLAGNDLQVFADTVVNNITGHSPGFYWSPAMIIISCLNILLLVISLVHLWTVFNTKKVRSRKTFSLFLWIMIISIGVYFIVPSASVEMFYIFLLPASYFITHYLVFRGNTRTANAMFAIISVSVLILQLS